MDSNDFKEVLLTLLAEAHGVREFAPQSVFLDSIEDGLFGQINSIDAETASARLAESHETIAAHGFHLLYTLKWFLAAERGEPFQPDWQGSWETQIVNDEQWQTLRDDLRATYNTFIGKITLRETWPRPVIGASMMVLAHTSYHVGVIDKMLTLTQ